MTAFINENNSDINYELKNKIDILKENNNLLNLNLKNLQNELETVQSDNTIKN